MVRRKADIPLRFQFTYLLITQAIKPLCTILPGASAHPLLDKLGECFVWSLIWKLAQYASVLSTEPVKELWPEAIWNAAHRVSLCFWTLIAFTAFAQVAGERLGLMDAHVRVERDADQVVRHVARHQPAGAEVVRQPNDMHPPLPNLQRLDAIRHQRPRLDGRARGRDRHPVAIRHAFLLRQLRVNLAEERGL